MISLNTFSSIVAILLLSFSSFANNDDRTISALRIQQSIKIDGILDEAIWGQALPATGFTQTEPTLGALPSHQTESYILYDDNAIYIGARMYDDNPDGILKELSLRDQVGNADNFRVFFDPYMSGLNGFKFHVTASGVQYEAIVSNHMDDPNWNAIWESDVHIDDKGWTVEIRIPYASLRFPTKDIQTWGLQIGREIRRLREVSYWSPIDPRINGWVQQSGKIVDLKDIKSPVRLSLTPYLTTYLNTTYNPKATSNRFNASPAYSAGLDLKYGLNDAFTMDMTLVPDFGQVISDKQVLNLSPFEVFFEDNRQFFTEGTELFNKGRLFYSRRIGDRPINYNKVTSQLGQNEVITENPETTQLFNATKLSGRTSKGTGIGFFNAVVGESQATILNTNTNQSRQVSTNPLSNYNAIVIDQNLKNNSYVTLMNTNVLRRGGDIDANVTGLYTSLRTRNQRFAFTGHGVATQRFLDETIDRGYTYSASVGKISGAWTYKLTHLLETDKYNPNDLGFLFSPNSREYNADIKFAQYKPKSKKLQEYSITSTTSYSRLFSPNHFSDFFTSMKTFVIYKTRFALGGEVRAEPVTTRDYFEPRTADLSKYLAYPINYMGSAFVSSDYRKQFAYDIRGSYRYYETPTSEIPRRNYSITIGPRWRINDKLSFIHQTSISYIQQEPGYVNKAIAGPKLPTLSPEDILFGNRNRRILENVLTGKFTFNSKMNISLRVRHYWDEVRYQSFGTLQSNGQLLKLNFDGLSNEKEPVFDRNFNLFNIDLQYNWRFAPGSDLIFVWKNQISNFDNNYDDTYFRNLSNTFGEIQGNNLSIRALYFIDYQSIAKRMGK